MQIIQDFKDYTNNTFELSPFQEKACQSIIQNKHVLVTAHTGSGKTLPAEFAIYYFVHVLKKKVIYTSPIKALSNQKYKEFKDKYKSMEVGILTGDIKHNPEADILIMTTEILQNNCFKQQNRGLFLDFEINMEEELGCVIFDEVHYIDDEDRGTIWEQTMIMLPDHIPFVMLSATIGQKEIFAKWIEKITNKEVVICHYDKRVVPLCFYEYYNIPDKYVSNIKDKSKKDLFHSKLKSNLKKIKMNDFYDYNILKNTKKCNFELSKDKYHVAQKFVVNECLKELRDNDMFPCLMFVFSRKQVEHYAQQITTPLYLEGEKDSYIEPYFRQKIVNHFSNWREYISLPEYKFYADLLEKGIGIHHAGMLPVFREIMEIMYEQKYIKCLIATETFAIGLNMPTRTVLFTSLYKHDGNKMRMLRSHEFTQMAGRAGRRNLDKIGHVILMSNFYEDPSETEYNHLFQTTPKVLKSKFRISYHLVLNYLHIYSEDDFIQMVEKSLMNIDIENQIKKNIINLKSLKNELQVYENMMTAYDFNLIEFFKHYDDIKEKMKLSKNKEKKKLSREIKNIEETHSQRMKQKHIYEKYTNLLQSIKQENIEKEFAENYIKEQIKGLYNLLEKNGFIDGNKKPTQKGLNACYLHELPSLVFCDFYENNNKLKDYNETEIICILSCFYDLKVKDDYKEHNPSCVKRELSYIKEKMNYYIDNEFNFNLYITCKYNLQYDLMEYIKTWYETIENENQCVEFLNTLKQEKDIFIGDFMKCCMKIINMCNELSVFCENDMNFELLEKIKKIQTKIQKHIVTNQSFYL